MINLATHRADLLARIDSATRLIDETHPGSPTGALMAPPPISREARGLVIVLLFASYENLLTTLTRTLLEAAIKLRVGNRRLQPGFRAMAMTNAGKSVMDTAPKKLFSHSLPLLVKTSDPGGRICTLDPSTFPADGSFMKSSQIMLWCKIFDIGSPSAILRRTWGSIDAVVADRNGIAHGRLTADQVGRNYSEPEIRKLIADWRDDWLDFLQVVETRASTRDFFRVP